MQSEFPLEMLRPLFENNPCFWGQANDQDFLCHSSVLSFENHKFFFGYFLILQIRKRGFSYQKYM